MKVHKAPESLAVWQEHFEPGYQRPVEPKPPIGTRRTFVLAANHSEFLGYMSARRLNPRRDATFIGRASWLMGLSDGRFIITGRWWLHAEAHEIRLQMLQIKAFNPDVTIEVDPY